MLFWTPILEYIKISPSPISKLSPDALANSADPDEMQHYAAFHLGLHYLPEYLFRDFQCNLCCCTI